MRTKTDVSCPICGNRWTFVHSWKTRPTFGSCDSCGYDHSTGYTGRGMIEHRRPKLLDDASYLRG